MNQDNKTKPVDPSAAGSPDNEALGLSYGVFVDGGYTGSHSDFFQLMCTNQEALETAYDDALGMGYEDSIDDFKALLGVTQAQNNVLEDEDLKKKVTASDSDYGPSPFPDEDDSIFAKERAIQEKYLEEYEKQRQADALNALKEARPDLDFPTTAEEFYAKKGETPPMLEATTVQKDIKDISAEEKKQREETAKKQSVPLGEDEAGKSILNTMTNAVGQLALTDDWMKYTLGVMLRDGGDYNIEPLSKLGIKWTAEAEKEIDRVQSYRRAVANFTDQESISMKLAAFADGVAGVGVSAAQNYLTMGTGLAASMVGQSIKTYNEERARSKGITVDELYEEGGYDIAVPALIGGVGYSFEKLSLATMGRSFNLMNASAKQILSRFLTATTTEGGTEGLQFLSEKINQYLGANPQSVKTLEMMLTPTGANIPMAVASDPEFVKYLSSLPFDPMFRESIYKGMAGGGFASGAGIITSRYLKSAEELAVQDKAMEGLEKTAEIRNKRNLTEEESQAVETVEGQYFSKIKDAQLKVEAIDQELSDTDRSRVNELGQELQSLNNQLYTVLNSPNYNEEQRNMVIQEFEDRANKVKTEIKSIRTATEQRLAEKPATEQEQTGEQNEEVDKSEFPLFEDNKGKKWRKVTTVKEGKDPVSMYVEDDKPLFRDEKGVLRPSATEKNELTGVSMSDSMLTPVQDVDQDQAQQQSVDDSIDSDKVDGTIREQFQDLDDVADADQVAILDAADQVTSIMQEQDPDLNIVVHKTSESYQAATGKQGRGAYNPNQKTIHIDLTKTNDKSTIYHETFHALLFSKLKSDPAIQQKTKELVELIRPNLDPGVQKKLDEFTSMYDDNFQSEEALTQLFTYLTSGEANLNKTTIQKIQQWINEVADMLGLSTMKFTGENIQRAQVIDQLNALAQSFQKGEVVTAEQAQFLGSEKATEAESLIREEKVGEFEKNYYEDTNKFQKLVDDNKVVFVGNAKEYIGPDKEVVIHQPDNMFVGDISHKGKKIIKGEGGIYYILNAGNVWASSPQASRRLAKMLNEARAKSKDGKAYMLFARGAQDKMISSTMGVKASMKVLETMVDEGMVPRSDFRSSLNRVGKKYGIDFSGADSAVAIKQDIETKFMKADSSTFQKRGTFFSDLVTDLGKTSDFVNTPENKKRIQQFLGSKKRISFSKAGIRNAIGDMLTERILQDLPNSHVYAAVEVDQDVQVEEDPTHESYPAVIKQKDGSRPKLIVFNQRENVDKVLKTKDGVTSEEAGKSFRGKIGMAQAGLGAARIREQKEDLDQAQGYFEQNQKVAEDMQKRDNGLNDTFVRRVWRLIFDRQADVKRLFKGDPDRRVYNALVTAAGAGAKAKYDFEQLRKNIFDGLSEAQQTALNQIIALRRVVEINRTRQDKRERAQELVDQYGSEFTQDKADEIMEDDLQYYYDYDSSTGKYTIREFNDYVRKNEKGEINKDSAQGALEQLRRLDPEAYEDFIKRSDFYFDAYKDMLKTLYDSGRISRGSYMYFRDVNYSPIRLVKAVIKDNESLFKDKLDHQAGVLGMTSKDIQALTDKNENAIIDDAEYMLAMSMAATQRKAFNNKLMQKVVEEVRKNPEAFEQFVTEESKGSKEKGFVPVRYFDKGVPKLIYVKEAIAAQLLDIRTPGRVTPEQLQKISKFSGVSLLKAFATGANPAFIIGNTAMDITNVAMFTDVYSKGALNFKPFAVAQISFDYIKNAIGKIVSDAKGEGNFKKIYEDFLAHGGGMDFLSQQGIDAYKSMKAPTILGYKITPAKRLVNAMAYLGTMSEQAVRISVYQKVLNDKIKEYQKLNGLRPKGKALEDIKFAAAAKSRESIDFSQGGRYAKNADHAFAYLNAAVQGVRRPIDFARENPGQFTSSVAQAAGLAFLAPIANAVILGLSGYDEEERRKIIKKMRDGSSKYEKANYMQIIDPRNPLDKNGNINYYRVRKLPGLNVITTPATEMYYSMITGDKYEWASTGQSIKNTLPFSGGFVDVLGGNPLISAGFALGNWDLFRNQNVVRLNPRKPINKIAEVDEDTAALYRYIAEGWDATAGGLGIETFSSPKRNQAALEKLITNPSTNPLVGLLYAAPETIYQMTNNGFDVKFLMTPITELAKGFEKRAYRTTNPNVKMYENQDAIEARIKDYNSKEYAFNNKIVKMIEEAADGKPMKRLPQDIINVIKTENDKKEHKRLIKKYTMRANSLDVPREFLNIIFASSDYVRAEHIMKIYGNSLDSQERRELERYMKKTTGRSIPKKTYLEYKKLISE